MSTPGSAYRCAPFTRKLTPSNVLSDPGPPDTSVGRPWGKPPLVMSSSPGIPVGAFRISERSNLCLAISNLSRCVNGVDAAALQSTRRVLTQDIYGRETGGVSQD